MAVGFDTAQYSDFFRKDPSALIVACHETTDLLACLPFGLWAECQLPVHLRLRNSARRDTHRKQRRENGPFYGAFDVQFLNTFTSWPPHKPFGGSAPKSDGNPTIKS